MILTKDEIANIIVEETQQALDEVMGPGLSLVVLLGGVYGINTFINLLRGEVAKAAGPEKAYIWSADRWLSRMNAARVWSTDANPAEKREAAKWAKAVVGNITGDTTGAPEGLETYPKNKRKMAHKLAKVEDALIKQHKRQSQHPDYQVQSARKKSDSDQ